MFTVQRCTECNYRINLGFLSQSDLKTDFSLYFLLRETPVLKSEKRLKEKITRIKN